MWYARVVLLTASFFIWRFIMLTDTRICHPPATSSPGYEGSPGWINKGYLSSTFYATSCPNLESIVRSEVETVVAQDPRMAASLLRLHFHDCFVNGCDASVMLDDTHAFTGEKTALPNSNSLRGFEVIDNIKAALERACPHTISCADILALAARDSVVMVNGPSWAVMLGRRDGTTANMSMANIALPAPFESLDAIATKFNNVGLSIEDMVTLSGAHTIGRGRCATFSNRLYNFNNTGAPDPTMEATILSSSQTLCPRNGDSSTLAPLDYLTQDAFDNKFFQNLKSNMGLLQSDQELYSTMNVTTIALVDIFSRNQYRFFDAFSRSMLKMGNINVLTGTAGQIRTNCRKIN